MSLKEIAMEEVAKHNKADDCWIVIGNDKTGGPKVYDVTDYLDDHPGGAEVLLDVGGQDADEFFEDIGHSKNARTELEKHLVGTVKIAEAELNRRADIVMSSTTGDENPQTIAATIINDIEEGKKEPCQPVLYRFDDFEVEVPTPLVAIPLASNQDGPKNSTNAGKIVCCCDTRQVVTKQLKNCKNKRSNLNLSSSQSCEYVLACYIHLSRVGCPCLEPFAGLP